MPPTSTNAATDLVLRPVEPRDMPAVADIYNHYVVHSTYTFAEQPEQPPYWNAWLTAHVGPHPAIVAEHEGRIVGWGTLSRWNTRCAYRFSVEDSVYVREGLHRRGIGRALLGEIIRLARIHGHRNLIAQIAGDQPASEGLHERFGFRRIGALRNVGYKFNRWIDVALWQLEIPQGSQSP